jgi:hypothetical protein
MVTKRRTSCLTLFLTNNNNTNTARGARKGELPNDTINFGSYGLGPFEKRRRHHAQQHYH